jgi:hypothetical protein
VRSLVPPSIAQLFFVARSVRTRIAASCMRRAKMATRVLCKVKLMVRRRELLPAWSRRLGLALRRTRYRRNQWCDKAASTQTSTRVVSMALRFHQLLAGRMLLLQPRSDVQANLRVELHPVLSLRMPLSRSPKPRQQYRKAPVPVRLLRNPTRRNQRPPQARPRDQHLRKGRPRIPSSHCSITS